MAGHGDEVAEVGRWAVGIDQVHRCVAGGGFGGRSPGGPGMTVGSNVFELVVASFLLKQ